MLIYGVALLATCLVIGMLVGQALGAALGIDANVGGVGIAMLLLVIASNSARFKDLSSGAAAQGALVGHLIATSRGALALAVILQVLSKQVL